MKFTSDDVLTAGTALTTRTIKINIEVSDNQDRSTGAAQPAGAGAQDVRLFRNGSRIKLWPGDVLRGQASITLQALVPIGPGENRFTAYAFNHDNIKSSDASLLVIGDKALKRPGTLYVLAVGISEYSNPEYNLRYAAKDAEAFSAELQKQQAKVGVYGSVKVIPLMDGNATKTNILGALRRLAGSETPVPAAAPDVLSEIRPAQIEDAVVVFFACHGAAVKDSFYLIPHDMGFDDKRSRLNSEDLQEILNHSISDKELEAALDQLTASRLLLVIDAANSGQALEAEEQRRGPMNSKGLAQLAYEKGMYILTASQSYQTSIESSQWQHGLLTFVLLEGLTTSKADTDRDGQITVLEWLNYATERVPELQIESMRNREARNHASALRISPYTTQDTEPEKRQPQRPRVFYRRDLEAQPWIIARSN